VVKSKLERTYFSVSGLVVSVRTQTIRRLNTVPATPSCSGDRPASVIVACTQERMTTARASHTDLDLNAPSTAGFIFIS
jgi:hypothetical protein